MHRRKRSYFSHNFFLFCLVFLTAVGVSAQNFNPIWDKAADGIEYAHLEREIDKLPVKMNLLRLDLTKVRLDVVHAMDAAIGLETVSSMATRHGAFAAINGGFFRLDKSIFAGDAAGILQIDGKLLSDSVDYSKSGLGRISLMIANKRRQTYVFMERMRATNMIFTKNKNFFIGTNRERGENEIVVFTKFFSDTTLTNDNGVEFIVQNNVVTKIIDGGGNSEIPKNGYVISVGSGANKEETLRCLKIGTKVRLIRASSSTVSHYRAPAFFAKAEDIVGGVPQLIKNGKIEITWEQEKSSKSFVETRHPRTAVAKLKDGKFLMITVDGRSEASGGINLQNLAEILLELGATDAMNLDGGGSTTMFLNGKIVNKPSDKEGERKVSDAILVTLRK